MTADYIAYHASLRPNAVAIVHNGREISYAELDRQVGNFTRALRGFGLHGGSWAAVECDDPCVHWLLLMGLEQLGIATFSFRHGETAESLHILAKADLVLSEHDPRVEGVTRRHAVTEEWLRSVLAQSAGDAATARVERPDETVRIGLTSGTTGSSNRIAVTRRAMEGRVRQCTWCHGLTHRTRYLVTLRFAVIAVYLEATACLQVGGTVVFESRLDTARALATHSITHVYLFPIMLGRILDQLPGAFPKPQDLTILVGGAALSAVLRERALRRLAREVHERYSAVEVGYVASNPGNAPGRFAMVWPGVQVEVVDDLDTPLPLGTTGRVRIRNDYMVASYLDDPEATARKFRGGWFYPGDLGILHGPRELQVVAREDEILNIGGIKFAPRELEDKLLKDPAIRDAGVCSIRNAAGIEEVWVGIEADGLDETALLPRVELAFGGFQLGLFHVKKLARIPRNANGKIERAALRNAVTA